MNRTIAVMIAATLIAPPAALAADAPPAAPALKPGVTGGTVIASEPGKAVVAQAVEVTATVIAIDKATRTVTLKGPNRIVDVVCGEEVRNFDQIHVGDHVVVQYQQALSLELTKMRKSGPPTEVGVAARAAPGERPGAGVGRQITALAEVVAVDPKKSIISLKGPHGNVVDLQVRNPDHFKVVKKGDQVEAVYTEALAISVAPASKAGK